MCVSGAAGAAALSRLAARLEEPVPLMWSAARTFLSRRAPAELKGALEAPSGDEDDGARPRVPPGLFPALLAAALGRGDGRRPRDLLSVRLLVKHWPEETLRLAEVLQAGRDMTSGMPPPIPRDEEETEKEATPALFLLWAYLDGLGHSRRPLLRTLDLRDGAGSSDSSPSFVTDSAFALGHHVDLLASRRAVEQLKIRIILNLDLMYLNEYHLWLKIMMAGGDGASSSAKEEEEEGQVCCRAVKVERLSCVFERGDEDGPSTPMLLSRLDPEFLTSLKFNLVEIDNSELASMEKHISSFRNLTSLDLSSGRLHVRDGGGGEKGGGGGGDRPLAALGRILDNLPKLKVLNLSNNRLGGGLKFCLEVLKRKPDFLALEELALKNCGLVESDLVFLHGVSAAPVSDRSARVPLRSLKVLDLGDNAAADPVYHDLLFELVKDLVHLEDLRLEESGLPDRRAPALCAAARRHLRRLRSLNLGGHHWGRRAVLDCVRELLGGPGGLPSAAPSPLERLVLPIYGLNDVTYRFRDHRYPSASKLQSLPPSNLGSLLEPVQESSSDLEQVRAAVEAAAAAAAAASGRNPSVAAVVAMRLDGMLCIFKK